jgi:hypothetical protein
VCAGHPVPGPADLATLGFEPGGSLVDHVGDALRRADRPPWHPAGQDGYLVDVRLDAEPASPELAGILPTLLAALDGPDPVPAVRALEVLRRQGWFPADRAVERWNHLRLQAHPRAPTLDLGRFFLRGVAERAKAGSQAHREAARELLAAGAEEPALRQAIRG